MGTVKLCYGKIMVFELRVQANTGWPRRTVMDSARKTVVCVCLMAFQIFLALSKM